MRLKGNRVNFRAVALFALGTLVLCAFAFVARAEAPPRDAGAASDWGGIDESEVRLVSATQAVGKADTVSLGLQFRMKKGWKIYWRSPGDAGYPPHLDWAGSDNLASATLSWPAPERFEVLGFETAGYEGDVILPIRATLKKAGRSLDARVAVDYLACQEICVPASAKLALLLPPGKPLQSSFAPFIDQANAAVPGDGSAAGLAIGEVESDAAGDILRIKASSKTGFKSPDVFVEGPEEFRFGAPVSKFSPDGLKAELTMPVTRSGAMTPSVSSKNLIGDKLVLTLVDNGRSMEKTVTVALGKFTSPPPTADGMIGKRLSTILLVALLGGLILNLMPCVLPVLSIKILKAVGHGGRELAEVRRSFLATSAGIVFSFLVLAAFAQALKMAGFAIGWGMQFQYPAFLAFMVAILTLFAANLWGWFEIPLPGFIADRVGATTLHESIGGSFLAGAFATLLATPCTAPFVGTAVGFALSRSGAEIFAVFAALGIGLALPYLLVAAVPRLAASLPRPGMWMVRLRQVLGFALAGTAVWLVTILAAEAGWKPAYIVLALMAAALAVLWAGAHRPRIRKIGAVVVAALMVAAVAVPTAIRSPTPATAKITDPGWRAFDLAAIPTLVASGKVVLVDVSADWCLTCKANEALVLDTRRISDEIIRSGVVAMRADWTKRDASIARYLASFGRYGIPFNVVYGPAAPNGIVLPELLTQRAVLDAFWRAGAHAVASDGAVAAGFQGPDG